MMYHIEQGSQITNQGGQLPDPHYIPSWATRQPQDQTTIHVHATAMAECQGCIAEQNIEHTCSLKPESKTSEEDKVTLDPEHHLHHDHHTPQQQCSHRSHHEQPQQQHQQQHLAQHHQEPKHHRQHSKTLPKSPADDHSNNTEDRPLETTKVLGEEQDRGLEGVAEDLNSSPAVARNTWPRKRVRQMPHVGSIFKPDGADNGDLNVSEARPGGTMAPVYFVSFDDSVCNGNISPTADSHRRQRSNRNSLPSELATVKKPTPLYGQPDWWGEVNEDDSNTASNSAKGDKNAASSKCSRPSSLGLTGDQGTAASSKSAMATPPKAGGTDGERVKYAGPTYMEIPIKDDELPDVPKDAPTPSKSVSSSLSRDSLSYSPDIKQHPAAKSIKEQSPSAELNPATSFTIDLDDPEHPPKKSLNIGSSLSEFVPSKIRKNFRERKALSSKASSKESTPSKNSEERELSPLHQQKIDEIWSQVVEKKGKASRLSSGHATVGTSLRSPNLEEIDRLSEFSEERRSTERDAEKTKKPLSVSTKSPQISKTAKVKSSPLATASHAPSSASQAHNPAPLSQYSNPASYLFDKMFETGSNASTTSSDKEMSPEQALYREASGHDRTPAHKLSSDIVRPVVNKSTTRHVPLNTPAKSREPSQRKTTYTLKREDSDDVEDEENDLQITEDLLEKDHKAGTVGKEDKEDKTSEAGTYTIEADIKDGEEEEEAARKRIDQVFGVDVDDFTSEKPVINPLRLASPGGYDNVYDELDNANEGDKTPLDENGSFPIDDDLTLDDDDLDEGDDQDNLDMPSPGDEVQIWVKQLTALTSHKSSDGAKMVKEDGEISLTKKPPQGLSRKRPGTGRKLPSIPTDKSPVSSEHSSYVGDQDISVGDEVPHDRTPDLPATRKSGVPTTNGKPARNSSQTLSRSRNGSNGYADDGSSTSRSTSARSRGSVDTELLLQDTETVMAAMEARIVYKSSRDKKNSHSTESDTDVSSTVALVNGDDDYVKPTLYKSPRDALSRRQQKDLSVKQTKHTSTPPMAQEKKLVGRSYSQTIASRSRSMASPRSIATTISNVTKKSLVSDVFSGRRDSFDNDSVISDVSSDTGDGSLSRSSSKGKGTITMTKPNRAFQLRRARADSFDEPTTPRSGKSGSSSRSSAAGSTARSSSVHSTTRTRSMVETNRSEATSLGAQIVRKSRANTTPDKVQKGSSNTNIARPDHHGKTSAGQRMQRASSLTIAHPAPALTPAKREQTPKANLRGTPTGGSKGNLSITGFSSRSQSQPGSRSNSPKAAERMAWKRRKEYDPRKAVADAKAKTRDPGSSSVTMRPKPSASSNIKRRMIRSASFTDTHKQVFSIHNSVSSSQDFGAVSRVDHEPEGLRRAFIPFHSSLRTDRSHHSADEDDSIVSGNSTQDSTRSLASLNVTSKLKSAFTPPPRSKNISPDAPSPFRQALSLRLKSAFNDGDTSFSTLSLAPEDERRDSRASVIEVPQASYDSLIVSSIYHISLKLKTTLDKVLDKLRDEDRLNVHPPLLDDYSSDSCRSEISAWKSANQELAGILKHLRNSERSVHNVPLVFNYCFNESLNSAVVSSVLFPEDERSHQIKRIPHEMSGFHPIDQPQENEIASPEMEELSGQF
ncbi:unnamed protein product [Lymnaea stagnalis]|uniref:Uncharacterized protein n=1 Tax=Lymnaea stagnalis TaxID=6523 RepID=A0AAV2HWQ8_LYMST